MTHPTRAAVPSPRSRLLPLLTLALLLPACQLLQGTPEQYPTAEIQSVDVADASAQQIVLRPTLAFTNPAQQSVPINDIDYDLYISDEKVLSDRAEISLDLPPGATQSATFDVAVPWSAFTDTLTAAQLGDGKIQYRLDGTMALPDIPLLDSIPVSRQGTLDLTQHITQLAPDGTLPNLTALRNLAQQLNLADPAGQLLPNHIPLLD
jgi:LEA14-like dessication related protein